MVNAMDVYKHVEKREHKERDEGMYSEIKDEEVMKDLSLYNSFDCKVLKSIIDYLRSNH